MKEVEGENVHGLPCSWRTDWEWKTNRNGYRFVNVFKEFVVPVKDHYKKT